MSISSSDFDYNKSNKREKLKVLEKKIIKLDNSPLYQFRVENGYLPVFGKGDINADIMFIGEAPGKQEAQSGHPFVGRAGKFLDELLNKIGLSRETVYITNIVKDRPPKNRTPRVDEIKVYQPFLIKEIEIIQPKIIATLGRIPLHVILKQVNHPYINLKISELHGEELTMNMAMGNKILLPLYHPAAVFYNRDLLEFMNEDFQRLSACYRNVLDLS